MKKVHFIFTFFFLLAYQTMQAQTPQDLKAYCQTLESEFSLIPEDRKENLKQIASYIKTRLAEQKKAEVVFICTHNSRRSQLAQVWAGLAYQYYGFAPEGLATFSGGTEATACNPRTVATLKRAGVQISTPVTVVNNPRYELQLNLAEKKQTLYLFSKKYNEESNPQKDFCAVLVCSQADESCPVVAGAGKRIYHSYEDPKKSDGSADEAKVYDATCRLIAREMFYMLSEAK